MSKLFIGQKVFVLCDNHELKRGTIHNLYDSLGVAIVKFNSGDIKKVQFEDIAVMEETKPKEPVKKERREKDLVTVTPADFMRIGAEVIADFGKKTEGLGMFVATMVIAELHTKLFDEESEDE